MSLFKGNLLDGEAEGVPGLEVICLRKRLGRHEHVVHAGQRRREEHLYSPGITNILVPNVAWELLKRRRGPYHAILSTKDPKELYHCPVFVPKIESPRMSLLVNLRLFESLDVNIVPFIIFSLKTGGIFVLIILLVL